MYSLLKPLLFQLNPETAHDICLAILSRWHKLIRQQNLHSPVNVMGLKFANPVGLAAGLDKNAQCLSAWQRLGFGFAEVGTLTPLPQPGNPKPRLFRLVQDNAIINRMGFNNWGIDKALVSLQHAPKHFTVGINIGKNKSTAVEVAYKDYCIGIKKAYAVADYITINISSPNTADLRELQRDTYLRDFLKNIEEQVKECQQINERVCPVVVKISPDNTDDELKQIAEYCSEHQISGIIATNTTLSRHHLQSKYRQEAGGLSGAPLTTMATRTLQILKQCIGNDMALIGVGGIMNPEDAKARFDAGADLIQLYTGFIYHGPNMISKIIKECQL